MPGREEEYLGSCGGDPYPRAVRPHLRQVVGPPLRPAHPGPARLAGQRSYSRRSGGEAAGGLQTGVYYILGDMIRTGADSEVNGAYIVLGQK